MDKSKQKRERYHPLAVNKVAEMYGYSARYVRQILKGDRKGLMADQRIASATTTPFLETSVRMDKSGNILESDAKYIEELIKAQILTKMSEQISNVEVIVPTEQDLINTSKLAVQIKIQPLGYLTWIVVTPHLGVFISAVLTGFAGFIFGKRKQRAETDAVVIENAVNTLKYYQDMVDDLGGKLKTAISELDEAMKRIKELEDTVELLTDELKKYKQLNRKKEN